MEPPPIAGCLEGEKNESNADSQNFHPDRTHIPSTHISLARSKSHGDAELLGCIEDQKVSGSAQLTATGAQGAFPGLVASGKTSGGGGAKNKIYAIYNGKCIIFLLEIEEQ